MQAFADIVHQRLGEHFRAFGWVPERLAVSGHKNRNSSRPIRELLRCTRTYFHPGRLEKLNEVCDVSLTHGIQCEWTPEYVPEIRSLGLRRMAQVSEPPSA